MSNAVDGYNSDKKDEEKFEVLTANVRKMVGIVKALNLRQTIGMVKRVRLVNLNKS
jgi:hypothetical protein